MNLGEFLEIFEISRTKFGFSKFKIDARMSAPSLLEEKFSIGKIRQFQPTRRVETLNR